MTVISTVITKHHTAHASDSFLTVLEANGSRRIIEAQKPKLVFVKPWRGAFAYWGLAQYQGWSTLDWLRQQAQKADQASSPEDFACRVADNLERELTKLRLSNPIDKGIGIHFTAYERVADSWIPELFLISNWTGIPYTDIRPTGVGVSRETYHTVKNIPSAPEHREFECRQEVRQSLASGTMLRYNNGDPQLFNAAANSIFDVFFSLLHRGVLNEPTTPETHCALARRPIEIVSRLLIDFCRNDARLVGGKPHDLCISPGGSCISTTGDCAG